MAVLSPCNAWAVGYYGTNQTLITHWDGASWTQVPSPDPGTESFLYGVHAMTVSNAWAVGYYFDGTIFKTLILHWDGSACTQAATPDLGGASIDDSFSAVGASTASDVWAVGDYYDGATQQTMAIHCC